MLLSQQILQLNTLENRVLLAPTLTQDHILWYNRIVSSVRNNFPYPEKLISLNLLIQSYFIFLRHTEALKQSTDNVSPASLKELSDFHNQIVTRKNPQVYQGKLQSVARQINKIYFISEFLLIAKKLKANQQQDPYHISANVFFKLERIIHICESAKSNEGDIFFINLLSKTQLAFQNIIKRFSITLDLVSQIVINEATPSSHNNLNPTYEKETRSIFSVCKTAPQSSEAILFIRKISDYGVALSVSTLTPYMPFN